MSACYNMAKLLKFINHLSFLKNSLHFMNLWRHGAATSNATVIDTSAAYSLLILTAPF